MEAKVIDPEAKKKWAQYRRERNYQLDALLRKVSKIGVDNLSNEEVAFLERVSAELAHELGTA